MHAHVYSDFGDLNPIAEKQVITADDGATTHWFFYVSDPMGTPEQLLRPDGSIAAELERTAFGKTTSVGDSTMDVRFPGQIADEETGLAYNFNRYYDPELGQYLSTDSLGVRGGTNLFAYCRNPITYCDPYGLETDDQHGLQMQVWDAQKNPQGGPSTNTSGGYEVTNKAEIAAAKKNNADMAAKGQEGPPQQVKQVTAPSASGAGDPPMKFAGKDQASVHTEDKALHRLNTSKADDPNGHKEAMDGGTAKVKGTYPPCKVCHGKRSVTAK